VRPQTLYVGDDAEGVGHEYGFCPLLHQGSDLLRIDGSGFELDIGHERHHSPVQEHAHPEGGRKGGQDDRVRGAQAKRFKRHSKGEIGIAERDTSGVSQQVARACNKLPGYLTGADLVGDDAGKDAAHVLPLHGRTENW
jgi:hypothetical protein